MRGLRRCSCDFARTAFGCGGGPATGCPRGDRALCLRFPAGAVLSDRARDQSGKLPPVLVDLGLEFGDPRVADAKERLIPGERL